MDEHVGYEVKVDLHVWRLRHYSPRPFVNHLRIAVAHGLAYRAFRETA